MGYKEEIFERVEIEGLTTISEIKSWLAGPKRKPSSYHNFAVQLQEPFAIREEAESIDETDPSNAPRLRELMEDTRTMSIDDAITRKIVKTKLTIAEREERKEIRRREREIAERIAREEEKEEIKRRLTEEAEERKAELRRLRKEEPQRLGGFRRAELRAGSTAARLLLAQGIS